MLDIACDCGRAHLSIRVLPLRCRCGAINWGDQRPPAPGFAPARSARSRPRTFGCVLRELVGCGCSSLPWAAWDRRGLAWCRDNADRIAKRLSSEPKAGLSEGRARELVQLAIETADRQATAGQSANQAGPSA